MTCIVGLIENGKIYLGGDSCGVSDNDYHIRKDKKVFRNGPMVMGFIDSFRMGQILQFNFKVPSHPRNMSDFRYMCSVFATEVIDTFTENGYIKNSGNRVEGGTFIIGYKGSLYTMYNDFQIEMLFDPYTAAGCGESYAKGALKILSPMKISPQKKVEKALKAAEAFSTDVRGPFNIVTL